MAGRFKLSLRRDWIRVLDPLDQCLRLFFLVSRAKTGGMLVSGILGYFWTQFYDEEPLVNRNVTGFNIPLIKINTVYIVEYYTGLPHLIHLFQVVQTQITTLIAGYYLYRITTFEISFSGSSDTNHDSLLWNTTYTRPPHLRYLF